MIENKLEQRIAITLLCAALAALMISGNRMSLVVVAAQLSLGLFFVFPLLTKRQRYRVTLGFIVLSMLVALLLAAQFWRRASTETPFKPEAIVQSIKHGLEHDPRWMIWSYILENPRAPWWHGTGFGITLFKQVYPEMHNTPETQLHLHAHNVILNKYVQLGLPGVLLWGALVVVVLCSLFTKQARAQTMQRTVLAMALGGALLKMQTDDFFSRDFGWAFWLLAGVAVALFKQSSKPSLTAQL